MRELALGEVMSWLRSRLSSALKPLAKEWKRLRKDAEKALSDMREACERIREEGERCVQDRDHRKHRPGRAAIRFHKLVMSVLEDVSFPGPELSTEAISALQRGLARVYNLVGKEWKGLLAQMEPYMIRARMRLKGAWRRIGEVVRSLDALIAECKPLEMEDQVSEAISRIEGLVEELRSVEAEIDLLMVEKGDVEKRVRELTKRKEALLASEALSALRAAEEEKRRLSIEVRTEMRHAWKPMTKLRASASSGLTSLSPDEEKALTAYLSDPVSALAQDGDGYPGLRALLTRLRDMLERGSISLKESKARKLRAWIEKALSGGLSGLQERCRNVLRELEEMRSSDAVKTTLSELEEVEECLSDLSLKAERINARLNSLTSKRESLARKLENEVRALEDLLADITGEEVRIRYYPGPGVREALARNFYK